MPVALFLFGIHERIIRMIYRREEFIQESREEERPVIRQVEVLTPQEEGDEKPRYIGEVTLMLQTPMGMHQMPVSFEIEAASVKEAFKKFDAYAEPRIAETRRAVEQELQRMRQESSKRIVSPDELGGGGGGNIIDFKNLKGR